MAVEELDTKSEHFVSQVVIDGDTVRIVCSCGITTKEHKQPKEQSKANPGAETEARKEYDKHYEEVMR